MGERVVINPAAAKEPILAVPLGYGRGGHAGDLWQRFRTTARTIAHDVRWRLVPWLDAVSDTVGRALEPLIIALGGWRQLGFAFGLAFIGGGIGFAIADEAVLMMWLGGLLIGLCLRIRALRG